MAFDLEGIVSAADDYKPQKFLIYGGQGIGKTTMGCSFLDPILLRIEDGAAAIEVATFPEIVTSYQDVVDAINALHQEGHPFKTLVIDSLDWLEPVLWAATLERLSEGKEKPYSSIEELGYGKGYVEADREWRNLLYGLDSLRINMGMQIVLVAHSEVKTFTPPDTDPYDRYQIKLHKRAFALCQEWSDVVLFANYRRSSLKVKDGGTNGQSKFRGLGKGERILYTEERPAYYAKNRWGLPSEIYIGTDPTWAAFHIAMNKVTKGQYVAPCIEPPEGMETVEDADETEA